MGWLRNFIRARTRQIPMDHALKMKARLSMLYFLSAWHLFALAIYLAVKESHPPTEEEKKYPSKYYAKLTASKDAKVMRFSGFKLVDEYEIKGMEQPERGKTWMQREREDREKEERERKNRQDLNLLVEETSSL